MKNTCLRRIIPVLLTALTVFPLLTSCSENGQNTAAGTTADVSENQSVVETEETTEARLYPDVPDTDFNGAEVKFLGVAERAYYSTVDIWVETMNGEPFNDAVYERNRAVEEEYNISIKYNDSDDVGNVVRKAVQAGDNVTDVAVCSWGAMVNLSTGGSLKDLNTVNYLDFDKPWWDQQIIDETAIANRVYYMNGEISISDNSCTRLVYFNKKIVNDFNLDSPYELVYSNEWVLDNYINMSKAVYTDLNGDGEVNEGDLFGMFREEGYQDFFFIASGKNFTSIDEDGKPSISFMSDDVFTVTDKIFSFMFDKTICFNIHDYKDLGDYSNLYTYARSVFAQDQQLFTICGTIVIEEFRDMESDFGILPMPKYDSKQENYRHYVDTGTNMIGVPVTAVDFDRVGIILEAMACESMYRITPVYNDTLLKRKYVRDNDSEGMLDIINNSRVYVLSLVHSFGDIRSVLSGPYGKKTAPQMSDYEKIAEKAAAAVEKVYNQYLELE